jgi:DNA polymerase III psi subunit
MGKMGFSNPRQKGKKQAGKNKACSKKAAETLDNPKFASLTNEGASCNKNVLWIQLCTTKCLRDN